MKFTKASRKLRLIGALLALLGAGSLVWSMGVDIHTHGFEWLVLNHTKRLYYMIRTLSIISAGYILGWIGLTIEH